MSRSVHRAGGSTGTSEPMCGVCPCVATPRLEGDTRGGGRCKRGKREKQKHVLGRCYRPQNQRVNTDRQGEARWTPSQSPGSPLHPRQSTWKITDSPVGGLVSQEREKQQGDQQAWLISGSLEQSGGMAATGILKGRSHPLTLEFTGPRKGGLS